MIFLIICTPHQNFSGDQIEKDDMRGACSMYEREEKYIQGCFGGKPEGKRPLGRHSSRWEDNIKTNLQEVGWGHGLDWIDLAQDRDRWRIIVKAVMNFRVP